MDEVINLISDSEKPSVPLIRPKEQAQLITEIPSEEDSDLEVVSHVKRDATGQDISQIVNNNASNVDVECVGSRVGVRALVDYPHFRFHCVTEPFKRQRYAKKLKFCGRCFCYVCDVPAGECRQWPDHAKAVDSVQKWRTEREHRLEERRRRDLNEVMRRRPAIARYSRPVEVREMVEDSGSLPSGEEGFDGEQSDEMEDVEMGDGWDEVEGMKGLDIGEDVFSMRRLGGALDGVGTVVLSSTLRNQNRRAATREGGLG